MRLLVQNLQSYVEWRHRDHYLGAILPALQREGFDLGLAYALEAGGAEARIDRAVPGIPLWDTRDRSAALQGIAGWRPDVVMENDGSDWDLGRTLATAYPAACFVHTHTGTCISGSKMRSLPTPVPCERVLGPACLALYLPCRCGGLNPVSGLKAYLAANERLETLRAYRKLLVGSEWMKTDLMRHGFAPEGIGVIPLFPDGGALSALPPLPERGGEILMLSRFTAVKGGDVLLRAIPLASARLGRTLKATLVGSGPELPALKRLAARLGEVPGGIRGGLLGTNPPASGADASRAELLPRSPASGRSLSGSSDSKPARWGCLR